MSDHFLELLFLQQLKGTGVVKINEKYAGFLPTCGTIDDTAELVRCTDTKLTREEISQASLTAIDMAAEIQENDSIKIITIFDEEYPEQLKKMGSKKPVILYCKGNLETLHRNCIAVVGTREPSQRTLSSGTALVQKIVSYTNPTIVSGLAIGCDTLAHTATLDAGGITVAVLPSGINNIAPVTNTYLANRIVNNGGCLVSEYAPKTPWSKFNFVRRDTIIAGLSKATIALECDVNSGTMHTIDGTKVLNRPVAAFLPDKIESGYMGNRKIIDEHGYKITTRNDLTGFLDDVLK